MIAAGGYVGNETMVAEYTPQLGSKLFPLASTYDDGLGIRLGASAGAELRCMDQAFITAPFYPPARLVTGIVVNKEGRRFVAEDSYHSRTSGFVMDQPDQAAYLIVDSEHIEHPDFPLCPFIDGWETVEEMEQALGIPDGALVATLSSYNEHAERKEDPEFHKHADWLEPQDTGPWGAYDLTLGKAMYAGFTMGGMRVSLDGEVRRDGRLGDPGPVRRRRLRGQHRPGRQGLRLRHPARRGLLLRAPGRPARGSPLKVAWRNRPRFRWNGGHGSHPLDERRRRRPPPRRTSSSRS